MVMAGCRRLRSFGADKETGMDALLLCGGGWHGLRPCARASPLPQEEGGFLRGSLGDGSGGILELSLGGEINI